MAFHSSKSQHIAQDCTSNVCQSAANDEKGVTVTSEGNIQAVEKRRVLFGPFCFHTMVGFANLSLVF